MAGCSTRGRKVVRPGHEEEFAAAWREPGAFPATLDHPPTAEPSRPTRVADLPITGGQSGTGTPATSPESRSTNTEHGAW